MYRIIISSILFSLCISNVGAQVKKIYGYSQAVSGGAKMADDLNSNSPNAENENNNRFFIFAEVEKGKRIGFEEVWIKGNSYAFKTDTVKKFPFILTTSNGGELIFRDTLVRTSGYCVIQLTNLVKTNKQVPKNNRNLIAKNDVVIFFRHNGRMKNISLPRVKKTKPLFTQ